MREVKKASAGKSYITILGALASFAVVAIHVNNFWDFRPDGSWIITDLVECLMYCAVPIFFMISGATLINYRERYTTKQYFLKRIKRTVIPFIVWSAIGAAFHFARVQDWSGTRNLISGILNCDFVMIYWFFPALFVAYLIIPFLSLVPIQKRRAGFGYAAIAGIIINSTLPFLAQILKIRYSADFVFPLAGFSLYLLIGYWVDNFWINKRQRRIIYILGVIGLLTRFVGTWFLSFRAGYLVETLSGYLNLPCILYSTAVFVAFRYMKTSKVSSVLHAIAKPLSPLTYGIYLVQWYVLQSFWAWGWISYDNFLVVVLWMVIVYIVCAVITYILSHIPVLRRLV